MKLSKAQWARDMRAKGEPVQFTMSPHQPWRGIDDKSYVLCPKKGVTTLDERPYGLFCGGCSDRIGNVDRGQAYRQQEDKNDDGR